jgi:hypothetical protein
MATTTNFGWETPDDSDLVKDGAAAMRTLGNSIDSSMADLRGGTSGQVLSKNSNTDMDFTWVAQDDSNAIQNAIVDAKGDLIAASAADTPARLAVGTNEHRLVAASGETTGLKYVADTTNYAIAAKGDLLVGTAADTLQALPVGTNDYVLTAASGETTGLKWAAASSGALVKIANTSFTDVASQSFNNVFSSTYQNYIAFLRIYGLTSNTIRFYWRSSGTDNTSSNYNWGAYQVDRGGTSSVSANGQDVANCVIGTSIASNASTPGRFTFTFYDPANTTTRKSFTFNAAYMNTNGATGWGHIQGYDSTSFDGFTLSAASGNITGNLQIYGVTP